VAARSDLLSDLLALPPSERSKYARELLDSLESVNDANAAEAWLDELELRNEEIDDGTAKIEDWDKVRSQIAAHMQTL